MNSTQLLRRLKSPISIATLCAFGILIIKFWPLFFGQTLYFGDNYSLMVPGKLFTINWLKQGVLPLWNPSIFSGIDWIGDINQSILYPSTVLFLLLTPAVALNATIILQLLIAFVGMYLLAREWGVNRNLFAFLAGCMWMLSTQLAGSIHNLSTIQTLPWLPLLMWLGLLIPKSKKAVLGFAIVVGLQLAAGYPQQVVYSVATALLFSIYKQWSVGNWFNWFKKWALAGVLALGLSAIIWVPFVINFLDSTRMAQTITQAQVGSLNPVMMFRLVVPQLFDNARLGMKWGPAWSGQPNVLFYLTWFGVLVLGSRLLPKTRRTRDDYFFLAVVLLTLLFSFGTYLPGFSFIQSLIPFFRVGRYPSMALIVTTVTLILWVNISLESFHLRKKAAVVWIVLFSLVAGLGLIGWLVSMYQPQLLWLAGNTITHQRLAVSAFHTAAKDAVIAQSIFINLLILGAVTALACFFWYKNRRAVVVMLLCFELAYSTQSMFLFAKNSVYASQQDLQASLPSFWSQLDWQNYRALTRNSNSPYADFGGYWEAMVVRAPFSDSFIDQKELDNQFLLTQLRNGLTPDWNMVVDVPYVHGYTTLLPNDYSAIWNVTDEPRINFIDRVALDNPELQRWATKYYVVDKWYPTYGEVFPEKIIAQDDRWVVYELPGVLGRFRFENDQSVKLLAHEENPNRIALTFTNDTEQSSLIVADRYDKDWQTVVNDQMVSIENVDGLRKIPIQPGQNEVVMTYVPRAFYLGLIISLVMLGCLLLGLVWQLRQDH